MICKSKSKLGTVCVTWQANPKVANVIIRVLNDGVAKQRLDVFMARITLIRHGKAEMPKIGENDFDRGLVRRGMKNAEAVGQFMQTHKLLPDLVLVSPARRTRQTYELMSAGWPNLPHVIYDDKSL